MEWRELTIIPVGGSPTDTGESPVLPVSHGVADEPTQKRVHWLFGLTEWIEVKDW